MKIYQDKIAIVTGGASGLGRSLALELAKAGARIIITDIVAERVEIVVKELKSVGAEARGDQVDHADYQQVRKFAETFFNEWDHVDVLCLNAGVAVGGVKDKAVVVSPGWQIWPLWLLVRFSTPLYSGVSRLIWKKGWVM